MIQATIFQHFYTKMGPFYGLSSGNLVLNHYSSESIVVFYTVKIIYRVEHYHLLNDSIIYMLEFKVQLQTSRCIRRTWI